MSLFPPSFFNPKTDPTVLAMFQGRAKSRHAGSNRSDELEKEVFADSWEERTRQVLAVLARLESHLFSATVSTSPILSCERR